MGHCAPDSASTAPSGRLIGGSPAMAGLRALIGRVAASDATVLIGGPSGSGKDVAARAIHEASARAGGPFVAVNCGAIARELLESELFGHEKGAFTGALAQRIGRFEAADGGTLFLDEIGDMALDMQVALLRVLEERRIERVGSTRSIAVDVRVIAATHRDLAQAVAQGSFREDLYYRINVFPLTVPALAERRQDIAALAAHFAAQHGERAPRLTPDALAWLAEQDWPGNVRELRNAIERLAVCFPGALVDAGAAHVLLARRAAPSPAAAAGVARLTLVGGSESAVRASRPAGTPDAIDPAALLAGGPVDLRAALDQMERGLIVAALAQSGEVVADAARLLNCQRTTLIEKMRRHGIGRGRLAQAIAA